MRPNDLNSWVELWSIWLQWKKFSGIQWKTICPSCHQQPSQSKVIWFLHKWFQGSGTEQDNVYNLKQNKTMSTFFWVDRGTQCPCLRAFKGGLVKERTKRRFLFQTMFNSDLEIYPFVTAHAVWSKAWGHRGCNAFDTTTWYWSCYTKSFQSFSVLKCLLFCLVQFHSVAILPPS